MEFTFNWSTWPFVEIGDLEDGGLRSRLKPELVADLEAWSLFMLENFDERTGFPSEQAENEANDKYQELTRRLRSENLIFTTSTWWS
jgi:hypothetical protein